MKGTKSPLKVSEIRGLASAGSELCRSVCGKEFVLGLAVLQPQTNIVMGAIRELPDWQTASLRIKASRLIGRQTSSGVDMASHDGSNP